jgi:hypothetical protein
MAKMATKTTDEKFAIFAIRRQGREKPLKWAKMAAEVAESSWAISPFPPHRPGWHWHWHWQSKLLALREAGLALMAVASY